MSVRLRSKKKDGPFPGRREVEWPGGFEYQSWDQMECFDYFEVPRDFTEEHVKSEMIRTGTDQDFMLWRHKGELFVVR